MVDAKITILTAARNRIAVAGVRGLRVNDVAAEAGVSPGLLYYHFTDRAGLLAATLGFIDSGARAYGAHGSALSLLLGEIDDDPEVRKNSVAWNELRSTAVFEKELASSLAETTAAWNQHVAHALVADGFAAEDAAPCAEILTSLIEGLSARWLSGSLTTERAHTLIRAALASLGVGIARQS